VKHPKTNKTCACGEIFLGGPTASMCPECRVKVRVKKPIYVWTPERDAILKARYDSRKGRAQELADLFRWPKWVISKRVQYLGLSVPPPSRNPWTKQETEFLLQWASRRSLKWISRRLKRSETVVGLKFKRMQISRAVHEGYTLRDLELCFGMDHHYIDRWIRERKLKVRHRDTNNENQPLQVSDEAVLEFIKKYPTAFRLDRVDQLWFLDLVLGTRALGEDAA
jgi:hypothetical protein